MIKKTVPVTKPYLPSRKKFDKYVDRIYGSNLLTNNGPLVQEFETRLSEYLGVKYILPVANGTLALMIAYKVLELCGEVITTPFSFVGTSSSLVWEGLTPVFADIDPETFNIDPEEIEKQVTKKTCAILPVHVFGNPCNVKEIQKIADKHNLKVIYDAAHAFGVQSEGKGVLNNGDISILSFHATKLFHSIEGGAIIFNNKAHYEKARAMINFGFEGGEVKELGINAKMNEFQAAMGLCVLDDADDILNKRKELFSCYHKNLKNQVQFQKFDPETYNYSYVPVLLKSEEELLKVQDELNKSGIFPRRYFHPSLNGLTYLEKKQKCPKSEDVSKRILCLPIYSYLDVSTIERITSFFKKGD